MYRKSKFHERLHRGAKNKLKALELQRRQELELPECNDRKDSPISIRRLVERMEAEDAAGLPRLEETIRYKFPEVWRYVIEVHRPAQLFRYRKTDAWLQKRQLVLNRDGHECKVCGKIKRLQVHHLTYDMLFREPLEHLITLCFECHESVHFDKNGKRRRDWKQYNPKPVLSTEAQPERTPVESE